MKIWRADYWLLGCIIIVALSLRLYRITNPVLDWHSFRQADTASVTREFVKSDYNLLIPHYQDLSNIQSGQDNLEGYRMVEFPIINWLIAGLVRIMPFLDLVILSRIWSILASLLTLVAIYLLGRELSGKKVGLIVAGVFALLPYSVFYSRVILPEPFLLASSSWAVIAFLFWIKTQRWRWYLLSIFSFSLALLLKPFAVFVLPAILALAPAYDQWKHKKVLVSYLLFVLSFVPMLAWREWIKNFPSGVPDSSWLFNSNGIRLRPAWFRWLGYERLTKMWLGYAGVIFLPLSLIGLNKKEMWVYGAWWLGMLAYLIVFATGNVQHDYYQTLLIPIFCLTVGRGVSMGWQCLAKKVDSNIASIIIVLLALVSLILSGEQIKGFFNVNHWEYQKAGQAVDQLTPPQAQVIAPAFGDTQFLFQTNRRGWPIGYEIEDKISKGATHYVTTSDDDEARELESRFFILEKTSSYLILDLTKPTNSTP